MVNQGQNEFQQFSGRVKVIIQTRTYTKDNFQTATKATSGPVEQGGARRAIVSPKFSAMIQGGPRLALILGLGSQGFRVIRGIMLTGN